MQNYIIVAITLLTFVPIVIGLLLGLMRGSRRALTRLILVLLCIVAAFLLCGTVTEKAVEIDISKYVGGEAPVTAVDYLVTMLGEEMQDVSEMIVPIAMILIKIVVFLLLFLVLLFLTWLIIFPILKIFIRPRTVKNDRGEVVKKKKHSLLGAVFGIIEGAAVALVLCIVLNGVLANFNSILALSNGVNDIMQEIQSSQPQAMAAEGEGEGSDGTSEGPMAGIDLSSIQALLDEYNESGLGKLYNGIGTEPFNWLAQIKTADDETITLNGQLEALNGIVDIAKEFVQIKNVDFTDFYTGADGEDSPVKKLTNILTNVENIKKGLSEEASKTVTKLLKMLGTKLGIDIDKYYNVDLAKEAKAFGKLSEYKDYDFTNKSEEEIKEAAKDIVSALVDSDLIMDALSDMEIDLGNGLNKEQRDEIDKVLDDLIADDTLTQEQVDRLRDIFKLNNANAN